MYPQPSSIRRVGILRAPFTGLILAMFSVAVGLQGCATLGLDSRQAQEDLKPRQVQASFLSVPLSFEANQGQTDPEVKFLSRGPGYGLFLTPSEAVLVLRKAKPAEADAITDETPNESGVLRMRLVGANPTPELAGETNLPGKVNYFIGNDPTQWRTNVPTYAQARYENVYPGIDLVYYGNQRQLEYDFVVAPGQDLASITMSFQGMERLELDDSGDLILQTAGGTIRQRKPVIYQEVAGERQEVAGSYVVKPDDQVGFQVAAYDATKPLIIDPILMLSTYLGGSGLDQGASIAVDDAGQAYVTGTTGSADFPTMNAVQPVFGGGIDTPEGFFGSVDAFVAQFTADGAALIYSTYLGGSSGDEGQGIAVDGMGQAYVTGTTASADFPTMNAVQAIFGGGVDTPAFADGDAFVAQLSPDGSALVYSTYLGGSNNDRGVSIALDDAGQASVTGNTESTDFPTSNPFQPVLAGSVDAFVAQFTANGAALNFSTYLGGSSRDDGASIAVDEVGQASVTGFTRSTDFPTKNAWQPAFGGGRGDAFVAQLTADGTALNFSTYLGGSDSEGASGIAVSAGEVYVTGTTSSTDFPTTPFQPDTDPDDTDGFVTKLTADGSSMSYSRYLGGNSHERCCDIAVDRAGQAFVIGTTFSADFPTMNAVQPVFVGGGSVPSDAFVAQLAEDGAALVFATYLGGNDWDEGLGIAVDEVGQASVTGFTRSTDFPTMNALQLTNGGGRDAFVAKIDTQRENLNDQFAPLGPGDVTTAFSMTPCGGVSAGTFTITATFTNISADTLSNLLLMVQTLTGGNVLCNANGGPGGAGATLTVPLEGDLADGQLSPGESFVVELPVGLQTFNPFTFLVDVLGEKK